MPKRMSDPIEPARKPGMTKTTTPPNDAEESALSPTVSTDTTGAESHVAPARSESTDDAATSPVKLDAGEDPEPSKETTDAQPSPAEPEAAALASPPDETTAAGAVSGEAGTASEAPAAPPNPPENSPQPTTGEPEDQPGESGDGGCFEPFIPEVPVAPAPKPVVQPPRNIFGDACDRALGIKRNPIPAPMDTASTPAEAESAQPDEILAAPVEAPIEPPRMATATEIFSWILKVFLALTCLTTEAAELITFWVISNRCQDALSVLPCLVITGPFNDAMVVLHVLRAFCWRPALVAGFRRSDLRVLCGYYRTNLVSEPNLDKRTAALLSNLTDPKFCVVDRGSMTRYRISTAIYAGEYPGTHTIENSIHIHISPTNAAQADAPPWLETMMERIPIHLDQYREMHLDYLHKWTWVPARAVSRETNAIATALGKCIVDAPELRRKLLVLLRSQDQQRLSEMSTTLEAVFSEALLALSGGGDGRANATSGEIADEVNRLLEARGETARVNPEKVGRLLKKLGLPTRRLSKSANGLAFDKTTVTKIHQLAAKYRLED
jgi:hypothetical protein